MQPSSSLDFENQVTVKPPRLFPTQLLVRVSGLAILFILEAIALSVWLDNEALAGAPGLTRLVHDWGAWGVRSVVGFAGLFVTFAFLKQRPLLEDISAGLAGQPVRGTLILLHVTAMALFGLLSGWVYSGSAANTLMANVLVMGWLAVGLAAVALGAGALIPFSGWIRLVQGTGHLWVAALLAIGAACAGGNAIRSLWRPAANLTFSVVHFLLGLFLHGVVAEPAKLLIGTPRFSVEIANECSGLEGIGLILAFTCLWLVLFRKECRFPNALVLLPAGTVVMFVLNAVRIACLVAIGNAGAERIALGGFHSQAGWIAFNLVALGFAGAAARIPWLAKKDPKEEPAGAVGAENPTAAYLMPLIAILASGMLAAAVSSGFEWFYGLRLFAGAGAIWCYRKQLAEISWRTSWRGPAVGVLVLAVWIGLDSANHRGADVEPTALSATSVASRSLWIVLRVLAAAITVPIAEELAFRGYLLRRFISADFRTVSLQRFTWFALAGSSVLFGILHGDRWLAATVAGLLYAMVMLKGAGLADAILAHATTNALLAGYVLCFGKWHFW